MPVNSYFTLYVPSDVGIPSDGADGLTITCLSFCVSSSVEIAWSSSTRLLTFTQIVLDENSYIVAPGPLSFEILGFTNPSTTTKAYFIFTSYAVLSAGTYMIDKISSMYI